MGTVMNVRNLHTFIEILDQFVAYCLHKEQFFSCENHGSVVGVGGGLMLHLTAAHLPVCVTYLQLAACDSGNGRIGCGLVVQNSNRKTVEHVRVAKTRCIYVARL